MANLTTQNIVAAGTKPTYSTPAASAAGDTAEVGNGGNTFLHVINSGATTRTVTLLMDHLTLATGDVHPDKEFTLADGSSTPTEVWIPLRKEYASADDYGVGRCGFTVGADSTDVKVAVVRMG
jgi:hypothetical protein